VPAALVVFAAVWITFHAVDALIVLSPFALIDTLLVALRASVLAMLGFGSFTSTVAMPGAAIVDVDHRAFRIVRHTMQQPDGH
jgi:hypothetical protein